MANGVYKITEDFEKALSDYRLLLGHDYLPNDMYKDGKKDLPIYLYANDKPDDVSYAGMFGVNPAVNEFAEENNYIVSQTDEC